MVLSFFDIETTGFNFREHDVLQLGFVRADETGKVINAGNLYFYKPEFAIENPEAQAVHGITREFLEKYEADFDKNMSGLTAMMHRGYLVGKNSDTFDVPFLKGWVNKMCPGMFMNYPNIWMTCDVQTIMAPRYQDEWFRQFGQATRKKGTLEEYVKLLHIEDFVKQMYDIAQSYAKEPARAGFHDALYDSVATYCVWLIARQQGWVEL